MALHLNCNCHVGTHVWVPPIAEELSNGLQVLHLHIQDERISSWHLYALGTRNNKTVNLGKHIEAEFKEKLNIQKPISIKKKEEEWSTCIVETRTETCVPRIPSNLLASSSLEKTLLSPGILSATWSPVFSAFCPGKNWSEKCWKREENFYLWSSSTVRRACLPTDPLYPCRLR